MGAANLAHREAKEGPRLLLMQTRQKLSVAVLNPLTRHYPGRTIICQSVIVKLGARTGSNVAGE